jgi:CHAT domain-containing protein/tetratricopeptide (TPR) repeat protein
VNLAMRAAWGRIAVIIVYCAWGARAEETGPGAQLAQAQKDLDEVKRLDQAGRYAKALSRAEHALLLREKALGPNHPEVAECLDWLGRLHGRLGSYVVAEPLHRRAFQILEATLGQDHPDVVSPLHNLANLYRAQGAYERAESLYHRVLQILEATQGKNLPAIARPLSDLADLYQKQGAYELAEPLHRRALQISEAALGKRHPEVAYSLDGLASLYWGQGAYERAEPLYLRALQILEATLGKKHPDVASSLNNLANLYEVQGAYSRAESLYKRALRIQEAALGKKHPDVASSLNNLALLYRDQGAFKRARSLYERALQIRETTLGARHPEVGSSLKEFALLNLAQNRLGEAVPLLERSFAISEQRLRKETLGFSEARSASFLRLLRAQDETLYNLLRERPSEIAVRRLALAAVLLHKGRSMDAIADTSRILYRSQSETDREAFQRLRALRTQLAALLLTGPRRLSPDAYQARLKDLETQADTLEAELSQRSYIFRAKRQLPEPADVIPHVAAALPPDGALIEIIAFEARALVPPPNTVPAQVRSTPVYFALVLLPEGDIRVADLGPAVVIDRAVERLRITVAHADITYLAAAQELYRLVFQPIAPLMDSRRQLFISPDGQLSLVPFAALQNGTRFLADEYDFTYLTSGKDLLHRNADIEPSRSVVVFADPAFEAAPSAPSVLEPTFTLERFFAQPHAVWTNQLWAPLPGTRQEAEAIRKLFPHAQLMMGQAATKKALLEVTAPGILHIGTHGAYLEDALTRLPSSTRGLLEPGGLAGGRPLHMSPDPLLRSVLVLAGARAPNPSGDDSRSSMEDSLVTALEIAGMNLWGTQLVVLSACDTGKGGVKLGQGVYGLRRAFTVAGAETVVTSLWRVNDDTTQELMKDYYQQLLSGQGRAHALREAMEVVRAHHPHPYYWAPFIVVGNSAPLRGLGASVEESLQPTR